jgi:hypothetical protein
LMVSMVSRKFLAMRNITLYSVCGFDRNISENKDYLSCVTNGEFYFSILQVLEFKMLIFFPNSLFGLQLIFFASKRLISNIFLTFPACF